MKLKDVLLGAAGRTLVDADGEKEEIALLPPVSPQRVAEIERELGFALPGELRELLAETAGLEMLEDLDLADIGPCPLEELFGWVLTAIGDGAGNFWIVELHPGQTTLGPVWFLCHDAPVLIYQSANLATFVTDTLRFAAAPHDGPVADVVDRAVQAVWLQKSDVPRAALLDAEDEVLRRFAHELTDGWFVRDLRQARTGRGRRRPLRLLVRRGHARRRAALHAGLVLRPLGSAGLHGLERHPQHDRVSRGRAARRVGFHAGAAEESSAAPAFVSVFERAAPAPAGAARADTPAHSGGSSYIPRFASRRRPWRTSSSHVARG